MVCPTANNSQYSEYSNVQGKGATEVGMYDYVCYDGEGSDTSTNLVQDVVNQKNHCVNQESRKNHDINQESALQITTNHKSLI